MGQKKVGKKKRQKSCKKIWGEKKSGGKKNVIKKFTKKVVLKVKKNIKKVETKMVEKKLGKKSWKKKIKKVDTKVGVKNDKKWCKNKKR